MGTGSKRLDSEEKISEQKTKNRIKKDVKEDYANYPDITNTASSCECTGMMYAPPQNEEEMEAYKDMSDMQIPKKEDKKSSK